MFNKKTVRDIDIKGKRVLLRTDFNVPINNAKISDYYRLRQSLPTIQYLLDNGASVIVCSHLGRPGGVPNVELSLFPVAKWLDSALPNNKVSFVNESVGEKVSSFVAKLEPGQVLLLENLRFHPEEEANDESFAKSLASLADYFVQDGFAVSYRSHASTDAITKFIPSVAGLLLEKEVLAIEKVTHDAKRPLMAVVGGTKVSDKIGVLRAMIDTADFVAVGGAMSNAFLMAQGIDVAKSLVDYDDLPLAKEILEKAKKRSKLGSFVFYVPNDGVVASKIDRATKTRIVDWSAHVVSSIENYPKRPPSEASRMGADEMILDIGPFSASFIAGSMQMAGTVVWNGTMGVTETPALQGAVGPFSNGSEILVQAMLGEFGHKPFSIVGGGETVEFIQKQKLINAFDHVSTGGGAFMSLLAGQKLPGIECLQQG